MGTTKVWVFVGVSGGIEDATEVYATEAEANARYEAYAREHGVPFEEDRQDFDWSASEDYCAWTTEAEVQERAPPSAVDRARLVSETLAKSHAARGGRYDARPGETREETFSRVVREAKGRLDELAAKDPAAADLIRRVLESAPPPKDDLLARCPYSGCGRELSRNGDGRIIPHDHTDDSPGGLEDRPRANY